MLFFFFFGCLSPLTKQTLKKGIIIIKQFSCLGIFIIFIGHVTQPRWVKNIQSAKKGPNKITHTLQQFGFSPHLFHHLKINFWVYISTRNWLKNRLLYSKPEGHYFIRECLLYTPTYTIFGTKILVWSHDSRVENYKFNFFTKVNCV